MYIIIFNFLMFLLRSIKQLNKSKTNSLPIFDYQIHVKYVSSFNVRYSRYYYKTYWKYIYNIRNLALQDCKIFMSLIYRNACKSNRFADIKMQGNISPFLRSIIYLKQSLLSRGIVCFKDLNLSFPLQTLHWILFNGVSYSFRIDFDSKKKIPFHNSHKVLKLSMIKITNLLTCYNWY